jgi:hypothetical protein
MGEGELANNRPISFKRNPMDRKSTVIGHRCLIRKLSGDIPQPLQKGQGLNCFSNDARPNFGKTV